ncbi:hypothetical protein P8452_64053 [Trifolium repens]|nr:hypothetical protein P8452_64053 [Trifolium repens]
MENNNNNNVTEDDKFLDETDHKTVLDGKSKNVPQDDEFGDEQHDHDICVASHLGLLEESVPKIKKSPAEWKLAFDADYNSFDPCNPWKYPPIEPARNLFSSSSSSSDGPQSPPSSDEDLIGIDS